MDCLRELLRRLPALAGMLAGGWMLIWPGPPLLEVHAPDFPRLFQQQLQRIGGTPDAAAYTRYVAGRTEGRSETVHGAAWVTLASSLTRDERQLARPDQPPFDRIIGGPAFRYLHIEETGAWLAVRRVWPQELHGAAEGLDYPLRSIGLVLVGAALLVYFGLPRRRDDPAALRYGRAAAVVLPDLLALLFAPFFALLPLLVVYFTVPGTSPFAVASGWIWLTAAFWLLAALLLSLLAVGYRYSCWRLYLTGAGLRLQGIGGTREIPLVEIEACSPYEDRRSGRIAAALLFFGGSLQALGLALVLRGNNEHGIALELHGGEHLRIMTNALENAERLVAALKQGGVRGAELLD